MPTSGYLLFLQRQHQHAARELRRMGGYPPGMRGGGLVGKTEWCRWIWVAVVDCKLNWRWYLASLYVQLSIIAAVQTRYRSSSESAVSLRVVRCGGWLEQLNSVAPQVCSEPRVCLR
jgi:hypothetical protein